MNDFKDRLADHVSASTPDAAPPYDEVLARRDRQRHRRRTTLVVVAAAASVAAAIGIGSVVRDRSPEPAPQTASESPSVSPTSRPSRPEQPRLDPDRPPPIQLLTGGDTTDVAPYTYCWTGPAVGGTATAACVDGVPGDDLEEVGSPPSVEFLFAADGWTFEATFVEPGEDCVRRFTVPVEKTGDQSFRIDPAGPAGAYEVDLFGRGPDGDVAASFRWTTPVDGTTPAPRAYMALISDDDGGLISYGLELSVSGLATTPRQAAAQVTVTAANGQSMSIDANPQRGCDSEGDVYFSGTDAQGQAAARLGPSPFTYVVELTLDGTTYTGRGVWPRDEREDEAPNVDLVFDPPLPGYTGRSPVGS